MSDPGRWLAAAGEELGVVQLGGKAVGLNRLRRLGLPVPSFLVLTTEAYRSCCPEGIVPEVEDARLAAILDRVWAQFGSESVPLAVRSSAVEEDGASRSWAGQMETHLNVTTRERLGRAVLACWQSLNGERARAYRALTGAECDEQGDAGAIAVIVQEMIRPTASGVMFTGDPVTGDRDRLLVSSVFGLGEGLVSGTLDADTFTMDRSGAVVDRHVVPKPERIVASCSGGTELVAAPDEEASRPSIDDATLRALVEHAVEAEANAGTPLDIEFAVDGHTLWFLQARPITSVPTTGERCVWDNSNIVESYPGITLPLTFSFIRRAYHAVYWQFCQLLGMGEEEIRGQDHMLRNMLGLHQGRVYYNLENWYRLVSILPGFRHNRRFMEGMMGVEEQGGEQVDRLSRSRGLVSLLGTAARAVWLQATLGRRVRRFHATFDRVHADFAALPCETMEPSEVLDAYRRVEQALLWRWKAPIVNDFSVMVFYGLLKHLTVRWGVDGAGNLQNALVANQGGVESTEVSDRLEELADEIRKNPELSRRVLDSSSSEAFSHIRADSEHGPALDAYMRRFGDRCVAELKLESRTLHDDPAPLVGALRAALRRDSQDRAYDRPDATGAAQEAVRLRLSPWRRMVYRWVLARARAGIRNRENQRLARTRAFALVRRMVRRVGRSFAAVGLLDDWEDVFFLELEELMALCDGNGTLSDPRTLVQARKTEFRRFESAPPLPDRFVTHGTVAVSPRIPEGPAAEPQTGGGLRGQAAYPGVVERRAEVMTQLDPERRLQGEILVTRQTDPGWVILFPSIGGLVVERGSMLSHSAIVAREMGIPAVVGVRGATEAIGTGDRVRLDGAAGLVHVLEAAEEGAA